MTDWVAKMILQINIQNLTFVITKVFFFFLSPMDFPPHWYAACLKWLLETQPVKWAEEERKPSPAEYIKIHTTSCRLSI